MPSLHQTLFAGLAAPVTPVASELAPVVELARTICAPLLRFGYDWPRAIVEDSVGEWSRGGAADQSLLVLVPLVLSMTGPEFMFELVQEAGTGNWRMAYAYGDQLRELSEAQRQHAASFLHTHVEGGSVRAYWK